MSVKKYFFSILFILSPIVALWAQGESDQDVQGINKQSCESEYVYEGQGSTMHFYEMFVSLEPVPKYYEQTFFLNRLFKTEGFYFQVFEEENLVSFIVSKALFSQLPVALVHEYFEEAHANQRALSLEERDDYLSMYKIITPGKDWTKVEGYREILFAPTTENGTCEDALPFCTGTNYTFPAGVGSGSGQSGPCYDCLQTTPNPAWYYMKIGDPGNIIIYMYSTPSYDIDFCCWGPFDNPYDACSQLTCDKVVDCSYSAAATETCDIYNGQTDDYYILLITNYSNQSCNINFSQTGGNGTTNCDILPPEASSNSPVCIGDDIELYAASQNGASYLWEGPAGFSSNEQNPIIENATQANAGAYTLTISQASGSSDTTIIVYVKEHPTANMYGNAEICEGDETYLFFDLTGDSPWDILYTDGEEVYEETTFLNQYSVAVSPVVSTSYTLLDVRDEFCYAEELTGGAEITIHPEIETMNLETVCNEEYTHYTVSFLITGGDQGSYEVTPPGNITPGPTAVFTSNPIPEGTPFEFSIVDSFDCDPTVVSGVKDCDCPAYGEIMGQDTLCSGESADIVVDLQGEAPWSIRYTVNGGDPVTIENIMETPYHLIVTPYETSEYNLTYVGDEFCDGTAVGSATIYVHPQPVSHYSSEGICEAEETLFFNEATIPNPGNIVSYWWDFDDNGATSSEENPAYIFSSNGDFEVSLTVTSNEGCTDVYTETVSIADLVEVDSGEDQLITYGTSTLLEATVSGGSGDFAYHWEPSDLVVNPESPTTETFNLYNESRFTLDVTDNVSGCAGSSAMWVNLDGYPLSAAPSANPPQACYGKGIQLFCNPQGGTESYSYLWVSDQGHRYEVANPAVESLTESTTFTVTVDDGFNEFEASVFVPVNPNPEIDAGDDLSIDYGYIASLNCEVLGGGSNFSFYWTPDDKVNNPYMQNPETVNLETSTNFNVTVNNEFGCTTEDHVYVEVVGGPLSASPYIEDDVICRYDTITLYSGAGGGGGGYTYQWSVSPGNWTSTDATPTFPTTDYGNYTFTVVVSDAYNSISGDIVIPVHALPEVDLSAEFDSIVAPHVVAVCVYDSVLLDAKNTGDAEYLWSTGEVSQEIMVGTTGIGGDSQYYSVLLTNKNTGCQYTADVTIIYSFAMCGYFVEELNGQQLEVEIYPNPATDRFTLSIKGVTEETQVVITDLEGRNYLYRATIAPNTDLFEEVVEMVNFPPGIYFMTLKSGGATHTQKIIKTVE
ncbi:MAG: hypothetical protein CSA95_05130 [Bacteroidetes bacterium]|nr:MAG: hypothetical protein CSA95_05130 [Bacteroidota bacterium]